MKVRYIVLAGGLIAVVNIIRLIFGKPAHDAKRGYGRRGSERDSRA